MLFSPGKTLLESCSITTVLKKALRREQNTRGIDEEEYTEKSKTLHEISGFAQLFHGKLGSNSPPPGGPLLRACWQPHSISYEFIRLWYSQNMPMVFVVLFQVFNFGAYSMLCRSRTNQDKQFYFLSLIRTSAMTKLKLLTELRTLTKVRNDTKFQAQAGRNKKVT